ncbi:hypothetical protein [Amycolatopsis regifaucium]|uniref:Uncharacterized protein n=1 Tax=Amycolatopsis regifaucium TaxID=546365 RepID=A0A154M587_9PSEU|nr:hypothetical protein [Amycolatopsis regifaucium]KZB79778.1 hypothetical protein AVL48_15425 [Amycolatopsis regifaucium]OKA09905.1 hypothetical protein ATP06_0205990 [Amycolatopsis regifaucium]SFI70144.1 hypothetical protein SAMN04489731_112190 [Amycolatopsis regifaucium]
MSLTTFQVPAPRSALMVRRRIATYFVGGVEQIPNLVAALGCLVHDLSVDVRDGVRESTMTCAVLIAEDQVDALLEGLRGLPSVVSSELL